MSWEYKKGNCPVCNGARRDCRENTFTKIIHCRHEEANPHLYYFLGNDSLGFSMWKLKSDVDQWKQERRKQWQLRVELERINRLEEARKQPAQQLSPRQRHQVLTKILAQLTLSDRHLQALKNRGLTDKQINDGGFRTVSQWQPLTIPVNNRLAGVSLTGDRLITPHAGILCPIKNHLGQYLGYQVRADQVIDGCKYIWAASERKRGQERPLVKLPSAELPLAFFPGENINIPLPEGIHNPLGLTEGIHIKPYIASLRTGLAIAGAAGGNFAGASKQLKQYLDHLKADALILFADGGAALNRNVSSQYQKLFKQAFKLKIPVFVAWWNQINKSAGDIDEIPDHTLSEIKYLSPDEFLEIARKEQITRLIIEEQKKLHSFSETINYTYESAYFPKLVNLIKDDFSGIINLIGHKGSGKSTQIKKIIRRYSARGYSVISLTPRINLGRGQGKDWGLQFLSDVDQKYKQLIAELNPMIGLCWDSLFRLLYREDEKLCLVIDEAETGIKHLLTSGTCKEQRPKLALVFEKLIQYIVTHGGVVILSDADLTDVSIKYIQDLAGKKLPSLSFKQTVNPKPYQAYMYREKAEIYQSIKDAIYLGEKISIATDNQEEAEALEGVIRDLDGAEDLKIVRIDRKTTEDEYYRNFIISPNQSLLAEKPDILIFTPSMGIGVDINIDGYFDRIFGLFFGNIPPNEVRQMLKRIRDNCQRHIWAEEKGYGYSQEISFFPEAIKKRMFHHHKTTSLCVLDLAKELAQNSDDSEVLVTLNRMWDKETQTWNNPHLDATAKILARTNYGLSQFYLQLLIELEEEGNIVSEAVEEAYLGLEDEVKEAKQEIRKHKAGGIVNAEDIELETAQQLNKKSSLTEEERFKIQKAFLKSELPGFPICIDFVLDVIQDNRRRLKQIKLEWYLANKEKTKLFDRQHWRHKLRQFSDGTTFLPDIKTYSGAATVLEEIGFWDLVEISNNWLLSTDDPRLEKFRHKCLKSRWKIKDSLGLRFTPKTQTIKFIGLILAKFGIKLFCRDKRKQEEAAIRTYAIKNDLSSDVFRRIVLECMDRKYELVKAQVEQKAQAEVVTYWSNGHEDITENEPDKNSKVEIAETKVQHDFNGGQERNVFLKKGFSAVPEENTTNQASEAENKILIHDYKNLKVGMPILIRQFGKLGDWIRVQITNLTENIVHYKESEYSSGSFPWGFGDVASA